MDRFSYNGRRKLVQWGYDLVRGSVHWRMGQRPLGRETYGPIDPWQSTEEAKRARLERATQDIIAKRLAKA